MQVTITQVSRKERTAKSGKPYTSLGLKTNEHGDKWLSGFGNKDNADWKAGDTVEIDVEQKGEYLNFSTPKSAAPTGFAVGTSEIKNLLTLQIIPQLEAIKKDITILAERQSLLLQRNGVKTDDDFPIPDFGEEEPASPFV